MNDLFTTRTVPTWATNLREPEGTPRLCDTKTERIAASGWIGTCGKQGREKGAGGEDTPQEPPRIRIDVPIGTSYLEIQASIFRQAWRLTGTQLRAAIALGITPDTISRVLRRCDRGINRAIGSSGHRAIDSENEPPGQAISVDRVSGRSAEQDRTDHRITGSSDQPISRDGVDHRVNPPPNQAILGDRVIGRSDERESPSPMALTPFSENEESDSLSAPSEDTERDEW
jgi:hypothetical protein